MVKGQTQPNGQRSNIAKWSKHSQMVKGQGISKWSRHSQMAKT
jgi:hypothetical protein